MKTMAKNELLKILEARPRSLQAFRWLYGNEAVSQYLKMSNVMAVNRLGYNDHGPVHAVISARNSAKILDLISRQIPPTIVDEGSGDIDDSTLVTVAGAYLHDIGNAVHRRSHEIHAVVLCAPIVRDLTHRIYDDESKATQIASEILHAVYSHEEDIRCLTIEAGCVRVGDGADMEKGRARVPYDLGSVDIHSLSALSIEKVEIVPGEDRPVLIRVHCSSSAGIFQVEKILGEKIRTSNIDHLIKVRSLVNGEDSGFELAY
jgi:hypothetical protein